VIAVISLFASLYLDNRQIGLANRQLQLMEKQDEILNRRVNFAVSLKAGVGINGPQFSKLMGGREQRKSRIRSKPGVDWFEPSIRIDAHARHDGGSYRERRPYGLNGDFTVIGGGVRARASSC
jgi:hypothetical protein